MPASLRAIIPAVDVSSRAALALLLFAATLGACSSVQPPAVPTAAPLFRAQPRVSASSTASPTARPAVPSTALPVASTFCTNDARFVADLTVPDGTIVSPGEEIDKRWSVLNAGTCDWTSGYRLVRVGTGAIGGPAELALFPARSGSTGEWQVSLQAPQEPGEYLARWRARAPDGSSFGEEVFVLIFVEEPTPLPTATASATAAP